jgi:tRNA (guanine-N7-)-methyltransferase
MVATQNNDADFFPQFFRKASVNKLFFCFPDPHFKRKNHGRRIVSERLLSEYAYILKVTGRLYCITDVKELHEWHVRECDAHPLFRRLSEDALKANPCVKAMTVETEEEKKVERNEGSKYHAVYERLEQPMEEASLSEENFFNDVKEGASS